MAKQTLFQFAILLHAEGDEDETLSAQVLIDYTSILAPSKAVAIALASEFIPKEHQLEIDRIEILLIEPFARRAGKDITGYRERYESMQELIQWSKTRSDQN